MTRSELKRKSQNGIFYLSSKEKKISDDGKTSIEFNDMCDNVIDIILCYLELEDLANFSDTNQRFRKIAGSVFSRKHKNSLISFDTFHYSHESELWPPCKNLLAILHSKQKPIVRIINAKIWFKILRNFGEFTKFIAIYCDYIKERTTKIPNALIGLNEYIHKYCTDSLETLELHCYKYFTLNKPLTKLREFVATSNLDDHGSIEAWKYWNLATLQLMPNLRSLDIQGVPIALDKYIPQLKRVCLYLGKEEAVHSFCSFVHLNRQITYLKLIRIDLPMEYDDIIFSAIEEKLTELKTFKITRMGNHERIAVAPIPTYRYKTVQSFSSSSFDNLVLNSFKFDNLKKLKINSKLNSEWVDFTFNNKKLKIFKIDYWDPNERLNRGEVRAIKQLTNLPELEQFIVQNDEMKNLSIYKTALGSEWEQIEMKQCIHNSENFKAKYQRIPEIFD